MKFRVIKLNWETNEMIYIGESLEFSECMDVEKEMLKDMPLRGENTLLLKISEDKGKEFDYSKSGGFFIFTHKEPWPFKPLISHIILKNVPYDEYNKIVSKYKIRRVIHCCDPSSKKICIVYKLIKGTYNICEQDVLYHLPRLNEPGSIKVYDYEKKEVEAFIKDTKNA